MKKRRWLILGGVLAVLLLLYAIATGWFEPRYGGMRARDYVIRALDVRSISTLDITNKLKPMGAKLAVPALIQALEIEDSRWRKTYAAWLSPCNCILPCSLFLFSSSISFCC